MGNDAVWSEARLAGLSRGLRERPVKRHGSPFERRAELVIECALAILGTGRDHQSGDINLPLSVADFSREFHKRYAHSHPELAFRTDATFERARLDRRRLPHLPRVILRQGPPPRSE
jgi:hypothetical protein